MSDASELRAIRQHVAQLEDRISQLEAKLTAPITFVPYRPPHIPTGLYDCTVKLNPVVPDENGCQGPGRNCVGVCVNHGGKAWTYDETKGLLP